MSVLIPTDYLLAPWLDEEKAIEDAMAYDIWKATPPVMDDEADALDRAVDARREQDCAELKARLLVVAHDGTPFNAIDLVYGVVVGMLPPRDYFVPGTLRSYVAQFIEEYGVSAVLAVLSQVYREIETSSEEAVKGR